MSTVDRLGPVPVDVPIFAKGAVRLKTVIAAFKAGTDIDALTAEFGVPRDDLLSVLRVHTEAA